MTTMPKRGRVDVELCTCYCRNRHVTNTQLHDSDCEYRRADHRAWQEWYTTKVAWEKSALADIAKGRRSHRALDLIEHYHGTGFGEISRDINYMVKLLRKDMKPRKDTT